MFDLNNLKDDKFRGEMGKLPVCQFLISKGPQKTTGIEGDLPILFLKNPAQAGWKRDKGVGVAYKHTFGNDETEEGIALESFNVNIINVSPILIELTDKGEKQGLGKRGQIVGNYSARGGYELRASFPELTTTLRTLYLLYLLDKENNLLHEMPYSLSIHGGASVFLGESITEFKTALTKAYADSTYSPDNKLYSFSDEAMSIAVFNVLSLGKKKSGKTIMSDVVAVQEFAVPTGETIDSFFNSKNADTVFATRKSMSGFADKYLKQFAEFHPNPSGLMLSGVDQETGEIYPPVKPQLSFANAKPYKPQEQADHDYPVDGELDYPPY
jgi:hypothetical protein